MTVHEIIWAKAVLGHRLFLLPSSSVALNHRMEFASDDIDGSSSLDAQAPEAAAAVSLLT